MNTCWFPAEGCCAIGGSRGLSPWASTASGDVEAAVDQRQRVVDLLIVRSGDGRRPVDRGGPVAVGRVAAVGLHVDLVLGDDRVGRAGGVIGDVAQPIARAILRRGRRALLAAGMAVQA